MTLCRPSSLLESDQEPQPFRGEGESEMGNCTVTIGTLVGGSHTREACFDHPLSLPQKEWGLKKIFQGQFASQKSACPRGKADEKPSIDTIETSGNPQFKGVDEP